MSIRIDTVYTAEGGYPHEIEKADKVFTRGQKVVIVGGRVGSFRTVVKIEGVEGDFNSCLFDANKEELFKKLPSEYGVVDLHKY